MQIRGTETLLWTVHHGSIHCNTVPCAVPCLLFFTFLTVIKPMNGSLGSSYMIDKVPFNGNRVHVMRAFTEVKVSVEDTTVLGANCQTRIFILQVPPSNGAKVCEFRLEWGLQGGSLQVAYHGPAACWEMSELIPATEYCCRVQVRGTPRGSLQYCQGYSSSIRARLLQFHT